MNSDDSGNDRAVIDTGGDLASPKRRTRSAAFGTLGTATALVFAQATVAIALLVVARRSETEAFGEYIGLYGASLAVGALLDFGSSQFRTRELARGVGRRHFRWWLRRRSLMQVPVVAIAAVVAVAVIGDGLPVLCTIGLVAQALTFNVSLGAMSAVRATRSPVLAEWYVGAGNLLLLVVSVVTPAEWLLSAAGLAAAGSWLVTSAAGLWATRQLVGGDASSIETNPWAGAVSFGVSSVATSIHGFLVGAIGWTSGAYEAALIGAVSKWAQPISLFAAAYASYMFPTFSGAPTDRSAISLMRPLRLIVGMGVAAAIVLIALGPFLIDILLGDDYEGAENVLRLLVLAAVPVLVAQPLSALLQSRGYEKFVAVTFAWMSIGVFGLTVASSFVLGAASIPLFSFVGSCVLIVVFGRRVISLWHDGAADVPVGGRADSMERRESA